MERNVIENEIKRYFEREGEKGDLSIQQWERMLACAMEQKREGWTWMTQATARPLITVTASLVLVATISGGTLWVTAPWGENTSSGPTLTDTPSAMPLAPYFDQAWEANKVLIAPGEQVAITLRLKNFRSERIEFTGFSPLTLKNIDIHSDEGTPIEWLESGEIPTSIEPGEEIVLIANVSSDITASLQSGRYNAGIEISFYHTTGKPDMGEVRMGLNSEILFVVQPSEGALDLSVQPGEVREANGASIRLETIHFTPEKTTITAFVALPDGAAVSMPVVVPTPTPGTPSRATPTPTAAPLPPAIGGIPNITARYRVDGGVWRELGGHGYRVTPEGIYNEWTFGPVAASASTFEFTIMSDTGSGEAARWEWSVDLRDE
jgi:hypothetical protein